MAESEPTSRLHSRRPDVIVVGAGFAGLETARRLQGFPVDVLVLDRNNYHTFTPLLYQVATAGLEPDSIVKPVRSILRRAANVRFRMADVRGFDLDRRYLMTDGGEIGYDYLVLAAGSEVNYFGSPDIARSAFPLHDLDDALALRSRVLSNFERAALEADEAERRRLMTIVIVGGGPTGVELAGALAELKRHVLRRDFPELDVEADSRVVLLEASSRLLPGFPPGLQAKAVAQLGDVGVEVRLNSAARSADGHGIVLADGTTLRSAAVIWVAGVNASPLAAMTSSPLSRGARLPVMPTLQLPGHPEVFVIGDMAAFEQDRQLLPMMAPVAIQQGRVAAQNLMALIEGRPLRSFRYHDRGIMATIGRQRAVAYLKPLRLSGFAAWLTWLAVHLFWLIGFRNKFLVLVDWAWNYLFYEQGARLITEKEKRQDQQATGS